MSHRTRAAWLILACTLATGCADQDCNQWYTFTISPAIQGGTPSILYGEHGLLLGQDYFSNWPPPPWVKRDSHTTETLRGGDEATLVVGDRGTIRYSRDDGLSWEVPELPPVSADLLAVQGDCATGLGAVAVGQAGTMLRTEDLAHWTLEAPIVDVTLRDVAYIDPVVVAVGDHGTIVLARSRGLNWSIIDAGIEDDILAVDFPAACIDDSRASSPGLLMTASGAFYTSEDQGHTWKRQSLDAPGKPRSMYVFNYFAGSDTFGGFAVEVAVDGQLWAINNITASSAKAWELQTSLEAPILGIFANAAVITQGDAHYYRDGFRCHDKP